MTKLIRHGSFVAPQEGFLAKLHLEINDLALRDLELLPLETLRIESGARMVEATVDMRNTQFIGADRIAFPDGYEPDVLALMDVILGSDDAFIDVGANWGYMSLHCLLRQDFHGRVIAIEPGERPRRDLQQLIDACGFADSIEVLPYAIGDRHDTARLSRPSWSGMATTIDITDGDAVEVRTFDELNLPEARLIKVDIEGAEAAFVRGASRYIERYKPSIVFESRTDTPGGDWAGPYTLLQELGYECFAVLADVKRSPSGLSVKVNLQPASPDNRSTFPDHLNILAIPDRAIVEVSPLRTHALSVHKVSSPKNVEGSSAPMAMTEQCMRVVELLKAIGLYEPYDRFDTHEIAPDVQGWGHEDPIFDYVLRHWGPKLILEVGTWKGASACRMAELQKSFGIEGLIVCVDTWLGSNATLWHDAKTRAALRIQNGYPSIFLQFVKNVLHAGHADRIRYMPMTSTCAAEVLTTAGIQADAIYIDAGHNEDEVYTDIMSYYPLLKPGGILFGDDYSASWPGTVKAVNRFVAETGLKLTGTEWKWLVQKPENAPAPAETKARSAAPVSTSGSDSPQSSLAYSMDLLSMQRIEALSLENRNLKAQLAVFEGQKDYVEWFEKIFGKKMPVPNTWPFTTFKQGTPWCDKVVYGMQDGEILYAEDLFKKLLAEKIDGDVVEFGIYYGHWIQVISEMQERHGWTRKVWGFDSFEGLPKPTDGVDPAFWTEGMYTAPYDEVCARLLVDKRPWLKLVKGWFNKTLIEAPATLIEKIAYARIDSDLYESCVDCLKFLDGRLADGAVVVFDDWQFSFDMGEPRALKEWLEHGASDRYRFEYLDMNMWAHFYTRVWKK